MSGDRAGGGRTAPPSLAVLRAEPLPLVPPPPETFGNYLGATNAKTVARLVAAVRASLARDARLPLLLCGPRGSGKSHLARAFVAEAHAGGGEAVYLDLGALGSETACALLAAGGWGRYACLALDGIENLRGQRAREEALLSLLVDTGGGASGLFMTEAADGEIGKGWILPDVVSRLRAAEILHLKPPNEDERRAIVRAYFVARRMPVGESVLAWIETHAPRDLTSLGALSAALLHEAERRKRRITLGLAREVLRSMPGSERGGDL